MTFSEAIAAVLARKMVQRLRPIIHRPVARLRNEYITLSVDEGELLDCRDFLGARHLGTADLTATNWEVCEEEPETKGDKS